MSQRENNTIYLLHGCSLIVSSLGTGLQAAAACPRLASRGITTCGPWLYGAVAHVPRQPHALAVVLSSPPRKLRKEFQAHPVARAHVTRNTAPVARRDMAASALQHEPHLLLLAGSGGRRHRPLLRMLPPRAPFLHRRRRWPLAVRVSSGDGGGAGGFASAVEKRSVPGAVGEDEGARGVEELEGEVAGALELRWPPWEGLPERYKLIGATSLAFVICNMDKVTHPVSVSSSGPCTGLRLQYTWPFALLQ